MFRRFFAVGMLLGAFFTASAQSSSYEAIVFQLTDGTTRSVNAQNLVMNVSDGKLVAANSTEQITLPLTSISKFYFGTTSGVVKLDADKLADTQMAVYTVDGKYVGTFSSPEQCEASLPHGVYVVKNSVSSFKITVR